MSLVASFHLTRYPPRRAGAAVAGLPARRRALRRVPGLRFARELGTGRGSAMGLGADLRRWATVLVWEEEAALEAFLDRETSPIAARWHEDGEETWSVRLRPLAAHGSWGGQAPFADLAVPPPERGGPVAVLTRARLRLRSWPAFYRAVAPVEAELHASDELLASVGIGEAPVGLQATFSLWRSAAGLEAFAYATSPGRAHADVVRRTRREGWFAEELFARFEPYGSTGTWSGRDPLARADGNGS